MLVSKIIDDTLNEVLLGTYRAHYNVLDGDLTNNQTSLTLLYPIAGISENSYLEIEQELMFVVPGGVNASAKSLSVVRGARGTTPAAHSSGADVSINPRFPRNTILKTMQEEARSWPTSLYQVSSFNTSISQTDTAVDVATQSGFTDVMRVIQVWRQSTVSPANRWIRVKGWRFEKDMLGAGSADLFLAQAFFSSALRIMVARPFNDVSGWTEATDITTSGLTDSMADILKYGAAWRLVNGRETRRLFTEVESEGRVAADVPATANLTLGRQLKALRDTRMGEEIFRLRSFYGFRGI